MYHNHNENIAQAREWIAYLKKSARQPSGNMADLLKSMIDDAITGHARIEELENALKEAHAIKVKKKVKKDKSDNDAKLPDQT
jgi:hypothetical protein